MGSRPRRRPSGPTRTTGDPGPATDEPRDYPVSPGAPATTGDAAAPSHWIVQHADRVPSGGEVLDVAAGSGRHTRYFLDRGHPVTAVDLRVDGLPAHPDLTVVRADLEADRWPFDGRRFAAVIVTRYLHRPLLPTLVASVQPGGVLLYETFMVGHERLGRPTNPHFLLRPGELQDAVAGTLNVIDRYEGPVTGARPMVVAAIAAVRPD